MYKLRLILRLTSTPFLGPNRKTTTPPSRFASVSEPSSRCRCGTHSNAYVADPDGYEVEIWFTCALGTGASGAANPADLSVLKQDATMLDDMLPIECSNVMYKQRDGGGLAKTEK